MILQLVLVALLVAVNGQTSDDPCDDNFCYGRSLGVYKGCKCGTVNVCAYHKDFDLNCGNKVKTIIDKVKETCSTAANPSPCNLDACGLWGYLTFCIDKTNGIYKACSCDQFIVCRRKIPYLLPCPSSKKWPWTLEENLCTETCNQPIDPPDSDTPCGSAACESSPLPFVAHCSDCSKFIQCDESGNIEVDCPGGQHWNDNSKSCDDPQNANCPYI